jgi:hypothetical protein
MLLKPGVSMEMRPLIPDALIRGHPFRIFDWDWDEDWVESSDGTVYQISQGVDILVASAALAILSLATDGRMTPQRIWRSKGDLMVNIGAPSGILITTGKFAMPEPISQR